MTTTFAAKSFTGTEHSESRAPFFASATGPGIAGRLIAGRGIYCLRISAVMLRVTRRLKARAGAA